MDDETQKELMEHLNHTTIEIMMNKAMKHCINKCVSITEDSARLKKGEKDCLATCASMWVDTMSGIEDLDDISGRLHR